MELIINNTYLTSKKIKKDFMKENKRVARVERGQPDSFGDVLPL